MAAARGQNENPYEDGGGFGKFRKRPFRKVHNTPYDRPPTAVRNSSFAAATANYSNGWLSKLVDPAQRLIASGAHKLFASIFRKRLPPPPPQPPEPEAKVGASNRDQDAVPKVSRGIEESVVNEIDYPGSSSDRGGLNELELILKQKTFTKSEIDSLTALLQSRIIDLPLGIEGKNSGVTPSEPVLSQEMKEVPMTPVKDDKLECYDIAIPTSVASSSVLDEDVATPAELAKAYMGSRPSKVSPPMLVMRGSAIGEESVAHINRPFPSKSPILSVVPRSSFRGVAVENGFVTPRSRGRSAIYNMAQTPYSRLHSNSTLKGTGSEIHVLGAPSSHSLWENGRDSGSKQGTLKRRSVFDSDIGSVGPIRRIRQKSNLLPSSGTHSIRGTVITSDSANLSSSSQKVALTSETITENEDNMARESCTFSVPSKSSEVASQILQQLDVLVPTRDKSPAKLSPSMLRGQALRSIDNVESSKFLETVQDNKKMDIRPGGSLPDMQKSVFLKEDSVRNGTANPLASHDKSASLLNFVDPTNLVKNKASDVKSTSLGLNSFAQTPSQKKRGFQMSAHEDFLELDDDDHSDKAPSATLSTEKVGGAVANDKASSVEASILEKTAAFSEGKNQSIAMLNQKAPGSSDRFTIPDKNAALTVAAASLSCISSQQVVMDNQATVTSEKAVSPMEPNAVAPSFSFAKKAVSPKEPNGFAPAFDFNSKTSVAASTLPVVAGPKGNPFLDSKSDNSSSLGFYAFNATKPVSKELESDNADGRNKLMGPLFNSNETASSGVSTSSPSNSSLFSFTGMSASASITNGSVGMAANSSITNGPIHTPSVSSADTGRPVSKTVTGQSSIGSSANTALGTNSVAITTTAANSNGTSSISTSTSTPSFVSGSAFKLSTSASAGVEMKEPKAKETSFGNLITSPFGSSLSPISSTGDSLFSSTSSAVKSTGNSIFGGTATSSNSFGISSAVATNGSSGIFSFNAGVANQSQSQSFSSFSAASTQASSGGATFAISSQSTPISIGTSASVPSFGFIASTALPSGSALFNSSASTDQLFSSGASFGLTSSTSAANTVGSTTNSTLSSSFPTPNFGSSSTQFVFGASSASGAIITASTCAAPAPAPPLFGSSTNVSSGSAFKFNSPAAATPSQPMFVSTPNPSLFSSSPSINDQMNMEDSMAEDTIQATTSTAPIFGQQPSSTFVFGSTAPTGSNQFLSPSASGVYPTFQFGSQPAPQNQSPFQASGSLEFNAGGSFSLGTGDKSARKFVRVSRKKKK